MQEKGSRSATTKKVIEPIVQKALILGMIMKPTISNPIDMISMLAQITIKVTLSKLFRIEEHKSKAFSWLEGMGDNNYNIEQNAIQQIPLVIEDSVLCLEFTKCY